MPSPENSQIQQEHRTEVEDPENPTLVEKNALVEIPLSGGLANRTNESTLRPRTESEEEKQAEPPTRKLKLDSVLSEVEASIPVVETKESEKTETEKEEQVATAPVPVPIDLTVPSAGAGFSPERRKSDSDTSDASAGTQILDAEATELVQAAEREITFTDEQLSECYSVLNEEDTNGYRAAVPVNVSNHSFSNLMQVVVDRHRKLKMAPQTLHIACSILSRCLVSTPVKEEEMELWCVTSLHIANKANEVMVLHVQDIIETCEKPVTRDSLFECEENMLKTIDWNVFCPTSYDMLGILRIYTGLERKHYVAARFLIELANCFVPFLQFNHATRAAAAVYIAKQCFSDRDCWTTESQDLTGFTETDLAPCVRTFCETLRLVYIDSNSVVEKYSAEEYGDVAHQVITGAAYIEA